MPQPAGSEPRRKIFRLNPGRIPEAAALDSMTTELVELRAIIVRESVGIDSPVRKLGAISQTVEAHSQSILKVMKAARTRHDGVLAADDALRLAYSIFLNVTIQVDWLQTAAFFKRLPSGPPENRELSTAKTREERERHLALVKGRTNVAVDLIDDLVHIGFIDPGMGPNAEDSINFLSSLKLQLQCNEINALLLARGVGRNRPGLPDNVLTNCRAELRTIASSDEFELRNDSAQWAVWHSLALVCSALDDDAGVAEAVVNRQKLTSGSVEDQIRGLSDVLKFSSSDLERLALIRELEVIGQQGLLGPLYSRERLGRVSIAGDAFAAIARSADPSDEAGRALCQASFACHELWMFGWSVPDDYPAIRIASDFYGNGRVFWKASGDVKFQDFQVDPAVVGRLIFSREGMSSNASLWRDIVEHQNLALGQSMAAALADRPQARFEAIGLAAQLPLSMISVDGSPIGSRQTFGYLHPRADKKLFGDAQIAWRPDLLVIDHTFGEDSRRVIAAARSARSASSGPFQVLEFNSDHAGERLERGQLFGALAASSAVIFYCHGASPLLNAASTGLLIGNGDTLTVEEIAALRLPHLEDAALVACSSGRGNPFVGQVTIAHALAIAGASTVAFSYWPIPQRHGADVAEMLLAEAATEASLCAIIARSVDPATPGSAAFSVIRQ